MILNNFETTKKPKIVPPEKYIINIWNPATEQRYIQHRKIIIKKLILKNN